MRVPGFWGSHAAEFFAENILYNNPLPDQLTPVVEGNTPEWLWPRTAETAEKTNTPRFERHADEVFDRMAGAWTWWGWQGGYFDSESDAENFYDEIRYMLAHGIAAPDIAQWKYAGLHWAYGIITHPHLHATDHFTGHIKKSGHGVERAPIIEEYIVSAERAEDGASLRLAESILSAKHSGFAVSAEMTSLPAGFESYLLHTGAEEGARHQLAVDIASHSLNKALSHIQKTHAQNQGAEYGGRLLAQILNLIIAACDPPPGENPPNWYDPKHNPDLALAVEEAQRQQIPPEFIQEAISIAKQGYREYPFDISGQAERREYGAKWSLRLSEKFLAAVEADRDWNFGETPEPGVKTEKARSIWQNVGRTLWQNNAPSCVFQDNLREWNPCPQSGAISGTAPSGGLAFLGNTGAAGATIDPLKLLTPMATIDAAAFEHAVRLWTLAMEIATAMSAHATPELAKNIHEYRPIRLGLCNTSALLFLQRIAFASEEARGTLAALHAALTGLAYATSAEIAEELGAFAGFTANRAAMLRVLRNHQRAAMGEDDGFEKLAIKPFALKTSLCPDLNLLSLARRAFDRAIELGQRHGFRNAQVTALQDTLPASALLQVHTRHLAPFQNAVAFVERSQGEAAQDLHPLLCQYLEQRGYSPDEITLIKQHVLGARSLAESPALNLETLRRKGLSEDALNAIQSAIPYCSRIEQLFSPWVLDGTGTASRQQAQLTGRPLLEKLGFTPKEIADAEKYCFGSSTLSDCPLLNNDDLDFLACLDQRDADVDDTTPLTTLNMAAAVQPFISGAVAFKLILPHTASITECQNAVLDAARLGLKTLGLYRRSPPVDLAALGQTGRIPLSPRAPLQAEHQAASPAPPPVVQQPPLEQKPHFRQNAQHPAPPSGMARGSREMLPNRRKGYTQKASVGGHKIYIRTGEYEDGRLGEIFMDMHKEGSAFRSLMNNFAIAISMGLQYGVPLEKFVSAFTQTRFEPAGAVEGNGAITTASSILDYVFRELAVSYLGRQDLANVKPEEYLPDALSTPKPPQTAPAIPQEAMEAVEKLASKGYVRSGLRVLEGGAAAAEPEDIMRDIRLSVLGATALEAEPEMDPED